jgi:hypothetical protein
LSERYRKAFSGNSLEQAARRVEIRQTGQANPAASVMAAGAFSQRILQSFSYIYFPGQMARLGRVLQNATLRWCSAACTAIWSAAKRANRWGLFRIPTFSPLIRHESNKASRTFSVYFAVPDPRNRLESRPALLKV